MVMKIFLPQWSHRVECAMIEVLIGQFMVVLLLRICLLLQNTNVFHLVHKSSPLD
jgi:hypothetical protein